MEAKYETHGGNKYLVLTASLVKATKRIPVDNVGKYACEHDFMLSDCGRCWDCGLKIK